MLLPQRLLVSDTHGDCHRQFGTRFSMRAAGRAVAGLVWAASHAPAPAVEQQLVLCSVQGPEPLQDGVLKGHAGRWPLTVTPGHLSPVVPSVGAHLVGAELPAALLKGKRNGQDGSNGSPTFPGTVWGASIAHRAVRVVRETFRCGVETALISGIAKFRAWLSKPLPACQIPAVLCQAGWHFIPTLQHPGTSGCSWTHPVASCCQADTHKPVGGRFEASDPSGPRLCGIL